MHIERLLCQYGTRTRTEMMRAQREGRSQACAQGSTSASEAAFIGEHVSLAITASSRALFAFLDLGVDFYRVFISTRPSGRNVSFALPAIDLVRTGLIATAVRTGDE